MKNNLNFNDFTGWAVVYKTVTRYPDFKEESWMETANNYNEAYKKALNAIQEYYARDIVIYYVVDGIAEKVINDFNTSIKNMRGKRNEN